MSKGGKQVVSLDRMIPEKNAQLQKQFEVKGFTKNEIIYIHNHMHECGHKGEFVELVSLIKAKCKEIAEDKK